MKTKLTLTELLRGAALLGEAEPRPGYPEDPAVEEWLTVAGLEARVSGFPGCYMLTVLIPALPCQGLHALWPEGEPHPLVILREPGHPAEVTLTREFGAECCCRDFRQYGNCGHIRAVSTIIGFADDKETQ
jgi:hypothetical protein